ADRQNRQRREHEARGQEHADADALGAGCERIATHAALGFESIARKNCCTSGFSLARTSAVGPTAMTCRSALIPIRSVIMYGLGRSWVTTIEVTLSRWFMSRINSLMRRTLIGSRPVVGSS